jgi:hypothetical protein
VGFLAKVWVKPLPHEKTSPAESGLVILKSEILEMRKIG